MRIRLEINKKKLNNVSFLYSSGDSFFRINMEHFYRTKSDKLKLFYLKIFPGQILHWKTSYIDIPFPPITQFKSFNSILEL